MKRKKIRFHNPANASRTVCCYQLSEVGDVIAPSDSSDESSAKFADAGRYFISLRGAAAMPLHGSLLLDGDQHESKYCPMCCSGPARLEARPLIARMQLRSSRAWEARAVDLDPLEPTGHLLLVPSDDDQPLPPRAHRLLANDFSDLVEIGRSCGRQFCVAYNSIGASAPCNHLHLVAWATARRTYGIATAQVVPDSEHFFLGGAVEASALDWPAACIRVRGGSAEQCGRVVGALCAAAGTFSVAVLGFSTYVFPRSAEAEMSSTISGLCLGAHHLLGHFVVESPEQLAAAVGAGGSDSSAIVAQCLRDTRGGGKGGTVEPPEAMLARLFEYGGRLMFY